MKEAALASGAKYFIWKSEPPEKLLDVLRDVPETQRTARFQCLLVYMRHGEDPTPIICQGTWEGRILFAPRGVNGFGYDPVFSSSLPPFLMCFDDP